MSCLMMLYLLTFKEIFLLVILRFTTYDQRVLKNESRFATAKSTLFHSEFNIDSKYMMLYKKKRHWYLCIFLVASMQTVGDFMFRI